MRRWPWASVVASVALAACGAADEGPPVVAAPSQPSANASVETAPAQPVAPPLELPPDGPRAKVLLAVMGEFPEALVEAVAEGLAAELDVQVERASTAELPQEAYYAPRRRYRADRILEHFGRRFAGEPASTRILGLTSVDISTTKGPHRDWGVFGLGLLGGRSCVVSTFRLRRRARDDEHLRFRVVTTAVHEVGHTLGLEHCQEDRCLMRDAEGSIQTVDTSAGQLGPGCQLELDRRSPRTAR